MTTVRREAARVQHGGKPEPSIPLRKLLLILVAIAVGALAGYRLDLVGPTVLALATFTALDRFDGFIR